MTLSVDWAQEVAAEWRPKFADEARFEASYFKYWDTATVPDAGRLAAWLANDLAKDQVLAQMPRHDPLLPVRSAFDLGDCYHCGGKWFVRKEVPVGHSDFGKAFPCPDCNR